MNIHSIAGRHGSYTTQFFRPSKSPFPTRAAMLKAHSLKALNRRLVIPIDTNNWMRALEIVYAKYAILGRTPQHFQSILRGLIQQSTTSSHQLKEHSDIISRIRGEAYAGEIPTNSSLWITLLWAHCALDDVENALECYAQAARREEFSFQTKKHMAGMLLELLSRHGRLEAAEDLVRGVSEAAKAQKERERDESKRWGNPGLDPERVHRLLAEAAARQGNWRKSLEELSTISSSSNTVDSSSVISALFQPQEDGSAFLNTSGKPQKDERGERKSSASPFACLSREALRRLFHALALTNDKQEEMLNCWKELYGSWEKSNPNNNMEKDFPPAEDVQYLLNGFALNKRFEDVLSAFTVYYLGCPGDHYTRVLTMGNKTKKEKGKGISSWEGAEVSSHLPLDPVALNLVFSSFPREEFTYKISSSSYCGLLPPHLKLERPLHSELIISLFNDLISRDDMIMTDYILNGVGFALVETGEVKRALRLLHGASIFSSSTTKRNINAAERNIQRRLIDLIFYIYHSSGQDIKNLALVDFPQLFPNELRLRRELSPPPQEDVRKEEHPITAASSSSSEQNKNDLSFHQPSELLSDEERIHGILKNRLPSSIRPSRHHYFPPRSTSLLTELQELRMADDFAAIHRENNNPEKHNTYWKDAEKDPRPIPKGLHDHASGWDFYGRGGEMVFNNHRRIPHPFSMHPKVMRALGNPYRGWNPRQNSCLAHKENVIKWNKKSAV
ncbi:unnamed protein product [Phytomonas sp. Hart1]|nr:unnamed protein product [Phytomonas sp. Hart1]|eukprot:CCW72117.1 unnamed protein product [Phytomonas sp. isolate Hart1]